MRMTPLRMPKEGKYSGVLLTLLLLHLWAAGQNISGTVLDSANATPIAGVSVTVDNSKTGVTTDENGKYTVTAEPSSTLIFNYVGYVEKRIKVEDGETIDVMMVPLNTLLSQVVVVAYGKQKKTSVTAAISTLNGEELRSVPISNVSNGLGGRVSGLIFRQPSGEPGNDTSNIYIRGISTTGSTQPLVVVDGVPRNFQHLDPNTIESITVLKDAAAVAPFGVAGANGVILVTTKRGKSGAPTLSYNGFVGFQNPTVLPDYVNSYQYATLRNAASANEGNPPRFSDIALEKFRDGSDPDAYANSNATKELVQRNTLLTSHNIQLSGGTDRVRYYASLGYLYEAGIWEPTYQKRFNYNVNLDADVTNTTKVSVGINGRQQKNTYPPVGTSRLFELIKYALPINPVRFSNGLNAAFPYGSVYESGYSNKNTSQLFTQISVEQNLPFIPGLSVKGSFAYDPTVDLYKTWTTPIHMWSLDTSQTPRKFIDGIFGQDKPSLNQSMNQAIQMTTQGSINYVSKFGKNNLAVLALIETKSLDVSTFGASRINYNVNLDEISLGSSSQADLSNNGTSSRSRQMGVVYRVSYDYDSKYLLEATGRYDGHYYFSPGKRFGFFPAVSVGWRLSEENFIRNNYAWIDNLKIRGSYGETGALAGGPFQYLNTYSVYGPAYIFSGSAVQGIRERIEANPNITWERAKKSNIGLEAAFWNGLLSFEFDYFYERRSNMLVNPNVIVPAEYGIGLSQVNAGVMKNSGFDFSVASSYRLSPDLRFSLTGNFTYAKNALLQVFETQTTFDNPNRRITGRPLGSQFGFVSMGLFQEDDFKNGVLNPDIAIQPWGTVKPGDIRYKDLSGDGQIDNDDITHIGNPVTPQIIYGISPSISYKSFILDVMFQGAAKTSFYGRDGYNWAFFNNMNVLVDNLDYWTPENTDAKHPRITNAPTPNNSQVSSYWLHNAAYLRLKSAMVSFSVPESFTTKLNIQALRIYASGQNLVTWTDIRNYDPEIVNNGGLNYPHQKVISFGLNVTF